MKTHLSVACFVVASLAACAEVQTVNPPVARVDAPAMRAGERWSYDEINPYRGGIVGTLEQTAASGAGRQEFAAPYVRWPFPLVPETSWTERVEAIDAQGRTYPWQIHSRANGWERVRTAAGEFDALKITRNMNLADGNGSWKNTERIETIWYAPAANGWVRLERRDFQIEKALAPNSRHDRRLWELRSHTG